MALDSTAEEACPTAADPLIKSIPSPRGRLRGAVLSRYPAFGFPLYSRYWRASAASIGATQLSVLAHGWLVFELTGSPMDLGLLGAAASIPYLLVSLFGGVIADRFDKRRIILATTGLNATLSLVLAALCQSSWIAVWHIWTVAGLSSLINGIEWPTRQSLFVKLIDRDALPSAVALNSFLWQSTRMIAPAIGGLMLANVAPATLFYVAACGYLWMVVSLYRIPIFQPGSQTESALSQIASGLRFIARNSLFLRLILLSFSCAFFAISYLQLMPAFANRLGVGELGFGLLLSATGVGSIVGTLAIGSLKGSRSLGLVLLTAALCTALSLAGFALAVKIESAPLAYFANFATAVFNSLYMINAMTVLQLKVPDSLRGRIMGIHTMTYSFLSLGGLFLGWIASQANPVLAATSGAVLFAGAVLALGFTSQSIRAIGR